MQSTAVGRVRDRKRCGTNESLLRLLLAFFQPGARFIAFLSPAGEIVVVSTDIVFRTSVETTRLGFVNRLKRKVAKTLDVNFLLARSIETRVERVLAPWQEQPLVPFDTAPTSLVCRRPGMKSSLHCRRVLFLERVLS
jgi:hypothetical protein